MLQIILIFVGINILNVVLNTTKSVLTVQGSIISAALSSGITYFVYTYANIITVNSNDINIHLRALMIALINIVFVGVSLWVMSKLRKERLWKIEFTIKNDYAGHNYVKTIDDIFDLANIPHRYTDIGKHTIFMCYCSTKKETQVVKNVILNYHGKYFITESRGEF